MPRAVRASSDAIFEVIRENKNNTPCKGAALSHLCFGSERFKRVEELVQTFLHANPQFEWCNRRDGFDGGMHTTLTCLPTDDSKENLIFFTGYDSSRFSLEIRKGVHLKSPLIRGFACESPNDENGLLHCEGTGAFSSYSLDWNKEGCKEKTGAAASPCNDRLHLFSSKKPEHPSGPPSEQTHSYGIWNCLSLLASIHSFYNAYTEVRKVYDAKSKKEGSLMKVAAEASLGLCMVASAFNLVTDPRLFVGFFLASVLLNELSSKNKKPASHSLTAR